MFHVLFLCRCLLVIVSSLKNNRKPRLSSTLCSPLGQLRVVQIVIIDVYHLLNNSSLYVNCVYNYFKKVASLMHVS